MADGNTFVRDVPVLRIGRARRAFDKAETSPRRRASVLWTGLFAAAWLLAAIALYGFFLMADAVLSLVSPA